jgi:hypothetical protein
MLNKESNFIVNTILLSIAFSFISMTTANAAYNGDPNKALVIKNIPSSISSELFRFQLKEFAYNYLGTRYKPSGHSPGGFDCSGFVSYIFENHGLLISRSSSALSHHGMRIPISSAKVGDLLFFAVKGRVHHVGMVVSNTEDELLMIHSSSSRGVIVENVWASAYWRKRLLFAKDFISDAIFATEEANQGTF